MANGVIDMPNETFPDDAYTVFCGYIDQYSIQRIATNLGVASNQKRKRVHLAFQSTGGVIGDGIFLYNYFKSYPIDLILYNIGQISSVAVIAYLAAGTRITNAHATFMVHNATSPAVAQTPETLKAAQHSLKIDNERMLEILKSRVSVTKTQWSRLRHKELWFTATDAVRSGIATSIGDFSPPKGAIVYTI